MGLVLDAGGGAIGFGLALIAVFLNGEEFLIDAAEEVDHGFEFGKVGFGIRPGSSLAHQGLGEASGGGLETDLGQVGRVVGAVVLEERILAESALEGVLAKRAPFGVTAVGDPIGNIAVGEDEAEFSEGEGDFFVGDAVGNHAADQIAFVAGKRGDGAGARAGVKDGEGWRGDGDLDRAVAGLGGGQMGCRGWEADQGHGIGVRFHGLGKVGEQSGEGRRLSIHEIIGWRPWSGWRRRAAARSPLINKEGEKLKNAVGLGDLSGNN